MTFPTPRENRYFEDYLPGAIHELSSTVVQADEMIAFARRFDPQPFHTDPVAAKESAFGGLIASGWFTASVTMRILVEEYVSGVASLGSPGVDELRWLKPVRPGDTLSPRITIVETRRLKSKPGQGYVRGFVEVFNQDGEVVMTWISGGFIRCREQAEKKGKKKKKAEEELTTKTPRHQEEKTKN